MRNSAALFASSLVFALLSTGCSSYVPFTYELRSAHRLTDDEVKNLQFYSSHEITLRRQVQSEDRQITPGHKLRLLSGKSVEEVVIPAKTPGAAVRVSSQVISVSFVTGTSLDFTVRGARVPSYGNTSDLLERIVDGRGSLHPRPVVSPSLLGQYAEPPGQPTVKIVRVPAPAPPLDEPGGNYVLAIEPSGQVAFAGLTWDAVDQTGQAHLLINEDKLEETEEKRTVLPGVRLGN
jgi:hypothetical protein